ncbi:hypothetical protein EVJ58_g926 [Rhodofomes roseus]|uniref:Uncharacterized protein n=1 Tax=Rhodofomes roseus TaxID=34475 RepID=A0A4Y9Z3H9_9APHY|nr:hypothetical protein EVJ58_g926 [Rhodofomes roseus]
MLGQPPLALAGFGADDDHSMHPTQGDWPSEGSDPDTDVILKRIYGDELVTEDISQLIVNEKLDGRDTLLMDVPIMPPPNEHAPSNMFLPRQTFELLAPAKTKPDQPGDQAVSSPSRLGQLKKVKGMQALTIELSWIPFKFGSSIPTDDEVSGVADSVQDALTAELRRDDPTLVIQLSELFNKAMHLDDGLDDERNVPSTRNCLNDSWDPLELVSREGEPVDMDFVLTRDERRTLRGHHEDEDLGSSDKENEDLIDSLQYEEDGPPPKRLRTTQEQDDSYLDDDFERAAPTDDSGVFLSPLEAMSKSHAAGFTEMAYAAEGFEGPYTDGNLFDDIDPVHELEFASDAPDVYMHHPSARASESRPSNTSALRRPFSWEHHEAEADARLAAPVRGASGLNHEANLVPAEHNISRGLPSAISRTPRTTAASAHCAEDRDDLRFPGSTSAENTAPVMVAHTQSVNVSSARRSLAEFLALMGKKGMTIAPSSSPPVPGPSNIELRMQSGGETIESLDSSIVVIPAEVLGPDTLCLPESGLRPAAMHRYLASVALLQKRALVRDLSSRECCIDLVEREDLGDADLILDSDTAVAFASLAALPSQVDSMLARLTRLSWRYSHILMVFEAYPNSLSFKSDLGSPRPVPYPFFAAVIKAVKKLRRDLSIAEACQTKKAGSAIRFAFATSVEEAALYVRYSGDDAEARDTAQGALWGAREWLDFDEQEGECDLAGVDGMNAFAASIILSQMSLDDFLDTSPEDRVQYFGPYVGHDRLVRFNEELQRRAQAVMSSSPSSHGATVPA